MSMVFEHCALISCIDMVSHSIGCLSIVAYRMFIPSPSYFTHTHTNQAPHIC